MLSEPASTAASSSVLATTPTPTEPLHDAEPTTSAVAASLLPAATATPAPMDSTTTTTLSTTTTTTNIATSTAATNIVTTNANDNATVEGNHNIGETSDRPAIVNREKSDGWHEHHNVPLNKDCPAAPFVHQLLRHATMTINEVEEKKVEAVLSSKGITDFDEHFLHNKEYWYKRVRMPPRRGDIASASLLSVLVFLKSEHAFKEYITEDVEKHITGWARRCREGRYEDLPDVEMYQHDGYDSDGLDKWLRNRGSKAENFHQKMHVAVGPFGIGVETAHYLQVILAYQYLVNGRIRRCGEPDFGHFMLHLEDSIQILMQQLWGVDPFANRINLSELTAVKFVAIGVGPLSLDEDYVTVGEPADGLNGDLLFMAEKMGVKYPPLPPSSRREFGMIKHFCSNNPQPKEKDYQQLCKEFNAQANGDDIWPKYITMIKPAVRRWQINQQARLVLLQAGDSYTSFINKLKSEKIFLPL